MKWEHTNQACKRPYQREPLRSPRCYRCDDFGHISPGCINEKRPRIMNREFNCPANLTTTTRNTQTKNYQQKNGTTIDELIPELEQLFQSYSRDSKSLITSFEKKCEENCKLLTIISELFIENSRLRTINRKNQHDFAQLSKTNASKDKTINEFRMNRTDLKLTTSETKRTEERHQTRHEFVNDKKKISTFMRIKPSKNPDCIQWRNNGNTLEIENRKGVPTENFKFDKVFEPDDTNETIFQSMLPLLTNAIEGKNVCIVAYDASGSGKSHTLNGSQNEVGIISKAVDHLLKEAKCQTDSFEMKFSMFEIYNEKTNDLLLEIGKPNRSNITRPTKVNLRSLEEFERHFRKAKIRRKTARTNRNHESSRSHQLIQVTLKRTPHKSRKTMGSNILFVDCAGTENSKDIQEDSAKHVRRFESVNINKTNAEFTRIISRLKSGDRFIDFRSSKLMCKLKPYFTGSTPILIIGTSSSENKHLTTTKATCRIIQATNQIKQKQPGGGSDDTQRISALDPPYKAKKRAV